MYMHTCIHWFISHVFVSLVQRPGLCSAIWSEHAVHTQPTQLIPQHPLLHSVLLRGICQDTHCWLPRPQTHAVSTTKRYMGWRCSHLEWLSLPAPGYAGMFFLCVICMLVLYVVCHETSFCMLDWCYWHMLYQVAYVWVNVWAFS